MAVRKKTTRKVVDDTTRIRCTAGIGVLREEVWQDDKGEVKKYNLAFILHNLFGGDNGRVLGYDNAHGHHERHYKGTVQSCPYVSYEKLLSTFLDEVDMLRKEKP